MSSVFACFPLTPTSASLLLLFSILAVLLLLALLLVLLLFPLLSLLQLPLLCWSDDAVRQWPRGLIGGSLDDVSVVKKLQLWLSSLRLKFLKYMFFVDFCVFEKKPGFLAENYRFNDRFFSQQVGMYILHEMNIHITYPRMCRSWYCQAGRAQMNRAGKYSVSTIYRRHI